MRIEPSLRTSQEVNAALVAALRSGRLASALLAVGVQLAGVSAAVPSGGHGRVGAAMGGAAGGAAAICLVLSAYLLAVRSRRRRAWGAAAASAQQHLKIVQEAAERSYGSGSLSSNKLKLKVGGVGRVLWGGRVGHELEGCWRALSTATLVADSSDCLWCPLLGLCAVIALDQGPCPGHLVRAAQGWRGDDSGLLCPWHRHPPPRPGLSLWPGGGCGSVGGGSQRLRDWVDTGNVWQC